MKIIEGNTGDGSSNSVTNSELLSILEDIQIDVKSIKGRVNA